MDNSLQSLWQKVREGDSRAWEVLVVRFTPLMLAIARRYSLSQTEAEDCVQYTWYSLYRSRHAVKDPNRLPGWLIRVVSRRSKYTLRHAARENRRLMQVEDPPEPDPPDEELLKFERAAMIQEALGRIGPRCRKLMEALFYSESRLSYEDIARELGIPVNSLGPTRARCLEKLRRALEEMNYWPCT